MIKVFVNPVLTRDTLVECRGLNTVFVPYVEGLLPPNHPVPAKRLSVTFKPWGVDEGLRSCRLPVSKTTEL